MFAAGVALVVEAVEAATAAEIGAAAAEALSAGSAVAGAVADPASAAIGYGLAGTTMAESFGAAGEFGTFAGSRLAGAVGAGEAGSAFLETGGARLAQGALSAGAGQAGRAYFEGVGGAVVSAGRSIMGEFPIYPKGLPQYHKDLILQQYLRSRNLSMVYGKSNAMLAKTRKITHRWSSGRGKLSTGNGTTGSEVISLNRIVNPGDSLNVADTHEPMGFIQMQAIYDQYTVVNTRLRVDYFLNQAQGTGAAGTVQGIVIGIGTKDDTGGLTENGRWQEMDDTIWTTCAPEGHGRLTYSCNPANYFGIPKKQVLSESTLRALTTGTQGQTRPSNEVFAHIWAYVIDHGSTATPEIELSITVEYDVVWQEPKDLAQSNYTTTDE